MRWYSYSFFIAVFSLFSVLSISVFSVDSAALLRIANLEKSALQEFSFDPFPLFVMLCSVMNIILAVVFITSGIPERELIISRFDSRLQYFGYVIKKQAANALFGSAVMTIAPIAYMALLCCFSGIANIAALYFLRQFVLLFLSSGTSLILRRSLSSGAADIAGAGLAIVLIMVDIFTDIPAALVDLSGTNLVAIGCEAAVCLAAVFGCYMRFKNKKEVLL